MLGFWQLRQKIQKLDYRSWSRAGLVIRQLEQYTKEARKLRDGGAIQVAREMWEQWIDEIDAALQKSSAKSTSRMPNHSYLYPKDTLGQKPLDNSIPAATNKTPNSLQVINLTRTRAVLRSMVRLFA